MSHGLRHALDRLGLSEFHDRFAAEDIDADMLGDLTEGDLRGLGLSTGQRKRVLRALGRLAAPPVAPRAHVIAERRQLTTLFCDLVGSTRLATLLDPEDLRDVIASFQALCSEVIASHAGHVAYSQGDGLMAYFGFPSAREDDPERAVRAALALRDRLAGLETAARRPLEARIGVATGVVVIGEPDSGATAGDIVVGETVNLAHRLQEAAGPGEVIVSDATRRLAGGLFDYEARGALDLKGFEAPAPVFSVLRETGRSNRFDERIASGLSPIVGRDVEIARLRQAWREAVAGEARLVLMSGEAGIGKSRLARALIDSIRDDAPAVIRWDCAAHFSNRALHPVAREIEAAAGLARAMTPRARAEAIAAFVARTDGLDASDAPALARLVGLAATGGAEPDAALRARLLTDALERRIGAVCAASPTLLLLEDAHWADASTLELVGKLLQRLARAPLLVAVTHRPDFEPPWSGSTRRVEVALEAIDAEAGGRLIETLVRQRALPGSTVRAILRKAGGVPLFVEELTRAVLDAADEKGEAADALVDLETPASLHDLLMARLDRLGDARQLAQFGAVIGREFTGQMLRVIAPECDDLAGGLRRLCEAGLACERSEGRDRVVTFRHALIQDTAYNSLLKKRRREIHRAIAQAMLAGDPAFAGAEPETVARHCTIGQMPEPAADHWLAAGLHALDRAANAAAIAYLRRGLEESAKLPPSESRSRRALASEQALAGAAMAVFGWASDEVETACRAARDLALALDDGESLFGAEWGLWSVQFLRGEQDLSLAAAEAVDAMARAAGAPLTLTLADHAVGYSRFWRGEHGEALARSEAIRARYDPDLERVIIRTLQLSSTVAAASFGATSTWALGREEAFQPAFDRALALAASLSHRPTLAYALGAAGQTLTMRRDWARLRDTALRLLRLAEEDGYRMWLTVAEMQLALARGHLGAAGDAAEAVAAFDAARERFVSTRTLVTDATQQAAAADLEVAAGRPERALRRLDAAIADTARRGERCHLSELHRARAEARAALGEIGLAEADLVEAWRVARAQQSPPLAGYVDACAARLGLASRRAAS